MGLAITAKGADFSSNPIGFNMPVEGALEFYNYFGADAARSYRNLAPSKAAPGVVGAPEINPTFIRCKGATNFLTTALVDQPEVTLAAVARPGETTTAFKFVLGSFVSPSGTSAGSNLMFRNTAASPPEAYAGRGASGSETIVAAITADPPSPTDWCFVVARIGAAVHRIDDRTRGQSASGAVTAPRAAATTQVYRIGSGSPTSGTALTDIAFASVFSRCITDAEVDALYARVKAYYATVGIVI